VVIDVEERLIEVRVSDEELAARRAAWMEPEPKVKSGWFGRYAKLVTSAGACLSFFRKFSWLFLERAIRKREEVC
jgi:dihydroxyacid dehydratase/phosphogluconate dehydratase